MSNIKKSIEETILKLRTTLLKEENALPSDDAEGHDDVAPEPQVDPEVLSQRSLISAKNYADRLSSGDRIRANNIIKDTLMRGYAGAVDATFIKDLDTRWTKDAVTGKGQRSLDTPNTIAYDYMIQMLASLYNIPEGKTANIDGKEFKVTAGMKKNIYEGLLKMFNLKDAAGRWKWFTFGSNIPGVSLVSPAYRPRISTKPDGSLDFEEVDNYMGYLDFWLKNGQLLRIMNSGGFHDKGFAYVLTAIRNKYTDLKRWEGKNKKVKASYDAYTDPDYKGLDLTDPAMLGAKKDLQGNIDTTMDLRYLGTKDNGVDPGHNSITRFVDALKVDLDGKSDLDMEDSEKEGMAKFIGSKLLNFVTTKFADKPHFIDLFKAKLNRNPASLNDITNPEFAEMYPYAYAKYKDQSRNAAQVNFRNAYSSVIKPEADRLEAEYIKQMDLDMKPTGASSDWKEKEKAGDEDKLTYQDYANPHSMVKRVNPITKKPETFDDYGDYWNSLEETEGGVNKKAMWAAISSAVDNFFLND